MSMNNQNLIQSINKSRLIGKENNRSLSPNLRPIQVANRPIQNNYFPKNQMMINKINNQNYNIKVNTIRVKDKNKIIEGDLNFNDNMKPLYLKNTRKQNFLTNKPKARGLPRKSPIPIPSSKQNDILNFNRIFSSNPKFRLKDSKKFNNTDNRFRPGLNSSNNYIFGGNFNALNSKSFNSFHKKNDRSHSPILRMGEMKGINIGKTTKNRYVSKSPNIGKNSIFNRGVTNYNMNLFHNNLNQINGKKKLIKNTNNNKININSKKNTVISGDLFQEPYRINKINNNYIRNGISKGNNIVNINIRPISNNNRLNVSANSANIINRNNFKNNINLNSNDYMFKNNLLNLNNSNSNKNIVRPISPKNMPDNFKNNNNNVINSNYISNLNKLNYNINNNNIINNEQNEEINIKQINLRKEESKEPNIIDNIKQEQKELKNIKIEKEPEPEIIKEKEEEPKQIQILKSEGADNKKEIQSQMHIQSAPINNNSTNTSPIKEEIIQKNKDINKTPKKVIKKIKDILPYTHVGFDGEEPKENNQDNYFIFKNFADRNDYIYMSVCDGHGVEGHFVSEFVKEVLPYYMSENLKDRNILSEKDKEITHQIITETFLIVNNMLVSNENINSLFSGSTCVSVIFTPERLIVPNIGDSRAVLGRFDKSTGKYKAIELSRDHKPTEKDEAKRIYENDGRIQPFTEEGEFVGPQRVWIKDEEVPGLAMTRSFGDRVAATVGVISEPEIKEFNFDENDKYMIIASDGIWEFISSQECIDIIQKFYETNDLKGCCEYLYQESSKRWLKEEEVIDDTTLILIFFE